MKKLPSLVLAASLAPTAYTSAQTVIADAAADYLTAPDGSATTAPSEAPEGWSYLYSDAASGGSEFPLVAQRAGTGNGGNIGFGSELDVTANFRTPIILGSVTGGGEYEIFTDGFSGNNNTSPGNAGVVGEDLLLHPGNVTERAYVIARYTISAADIAAGTNATISGSFRELVIHNTPNANNGGSVDVFVYHNTTALFSVDQVNDAVIAEAGLLMADGTFEITDLTVAADDTISFVVGNNDAYFGDETALQASISLSGGGGADDGFRIFIAGDPNGSTLQISWTEIEGMSYNLRSSTTLENDPATWGIVSPHFGMVIEDSPITVTKPADPQTFYIIEAFED